MTRWNQWLVLWYYKPNKNLHAKKFCISSSVTVLPICKGEDSFFRHVGLDPVIYATVSENKQIFESNSELVGTLLPEISTQDQEKHFLSWLTTGLSCSWTQKYWIGKLFYRSNKWSK